MRFMIDGNLLFLFDHGGFERRDLLRKKFRGFPGLLPALLQILVEKTGDAPGLAATKTAAGVSPRNG